MGQRDVVTVIGGGVAGLVAAAEVAEAGAAVHLLEARSRLGGRGTSSPSPWVANLGPHALYTDTVLWDWVQQRCLVSVTKTPTRNRNMFRWQGEGRHTPPSALMRPGIFRGDVPVDVDLRTWATQRWGTETAAAVAGLGGPATFDHDPGRLSASFVMERVRKFLFAPRIKARYVPGGWSGLVDAMAGYVASLGVTVETGAAVDATALGGLRDAGPVILAVDPGAARRLLADAVGEGERRRVATVDIGVDAGPDPSLVVDLDEAIFLTRPSAVLDGLVPAGSQLMQISAGMAPGESLEAAVGRIESMLGTVSPTWRERVQWRRRAGLWDSAGAVDLPGTTWRDRPAVDRGDGLWLAGDWVAAPGHLAEVSCVSARTAAAGAVDALRHSRRVAGRAGS